MAIIVGEARPPTTTGVLTSCFKKQLFLLRRLGPFRVWFAGSDFAAAPALRHRFHHLQHERDCGMQMETSTEGIAMWCYSEVELKRQINPREGSRGKVLTVKWGFKHPFRGKVPGE